MLWDTHAFHNVKRLTGGRDDSGGAIGVGRALDAWGVLDAPDVLGARGVQLRVRGARA